MKNLKKQKGITLIALVITIIVLLILAGVTIGMLIGENGILKNAKLSAEKYSEQSAREQLEAKLAEMQTEKILKKAEYNQNEYLTQKLIDEGFGVSGDIVIVDEWQFLIDRSVPKIVESLGKGIKNEKIEIELSKEVLEDYTKATIIIKVTATEEIKSVLLNGEEVKDLIQEDGTIGKEVAQNGTHNVIAKDINDNYNMKSITITEITEDMDIWNKEDLVAFREKVNSGRTFEGRTVRVKADIQINPNKYTVADGGVITFNPEAEQWIPIANYGEDNTLTFKGTLEGNKHKIKGLYIENDKTYQGLFGYNEGTIKDLIIEEGYIKGTAATSTYDLGTTPATTYAVATGSAYIGAITGTNAGGQIINCTNKIKVEGNTLVGGIVGYNAYKEGKKSIIENCTNEGEITGIGTGNRMHAGGIVGTNQSEINNSINIGKISSNFNSTFVNYLGGIAGGSEGEGVIINNCINEGEVINEGTAEENVYSAGISGYSLAKVINCVNKGVITNSGKANTMLRAGGITGGAEGIIQNCYNVETVTCSGTGPSNVGGITGLAWNSAKVINCGNKGEVLNTGKTTSTSQYLRTGGIVGDTDGSSIQNCYNVATVTCSGTGKADVGGIAGLSYSSGKVHLCYNTGKVSNTATSTKRTGAISGYNNISITNCYYLSGTASAGIGSGTTTGTTAMTDANMKLETFVNTLNSLRQDGYLEWVKTETYPEFKTN